MSSSTRNNESLLYFAAGVVATLAVTKFMEQRQAKGGAFDRDSGAYCASCPYFSMDAVI